MNAAPPEICPDPAPLADWEARALALGWPEHEIAGFDASGVDVVHVDAYVLACRTPGGALLRLVRDVRSLPANDEKGTAVAVVKAANDATAHLAPEQPSRLAARPSGAPSRQVRRAQARQVEIPPQAVERLELRPVQERALERVRAAIRRGVRRILLVAPTGFGKTATASELMRRCVERNKRVLFLVHRREIVRDTATRLRRAGVACGVVMADAPPPGDVHVLVCSVQTLYARDARPPADVLIWDEAHHCAAETYREIAASYPAALHLGLTATPERSDNTGLGDAFDELVVAASVRELIAAGLLVPCTVVGPRRPLDTLAEDPVAMWQQHAAGRRTVVFAANVAHAEGLAAQFGALGVTAACVHSETPARERDRILADFAAGLITVLTNVFVLTEGWDAPATEVCLIARGCGSAAQYIQMVGRVLRIAAGKTRALLLDPRGVVHQHGLPDDDREFDLAGDPIRVRDALPALRTCPVCGATFRSRPICVRPGCEYVFPPPPAPRVAAAPAALAAIAAVVPREEKLARWDLLCREARAKGHKPQWAGFRFKEKYGHWPPRNFPKFHEVVA